jgi:hypothetical protein
MDQQPQPRVSLSLNKVISSAVTCTALLFFIGCNNKFLRKEATPPPSLPPSEQLKYLVETGEQDRSSNLIRFFIFPNGKKVKSVWQRDSMRCAYFLSLERTYLPSTGEDKWNAGVLLLHGDGKLNCRDTVLLLKSVNYFKDIKENGPRIGDKKNGEIWYPQAMSSYTYLIDECKKRKKASK